VDYFTADGKDEFTPIFFTGNVEKSDRPLKGNIKGNLKLADGI
jgi:hypothetical protein